MLSTPQQHLCQHVPRVLLYTRVTSLSLVPSLSRAHHMLAPERMIAIQKIAVPFSIFKIMSVSKTTGMGRGEREQDLCTVEAFMKISTLPRFSAIR